MLSIPRYGCVLLDATGDPDPLPYTLYYRKLGLGGTIGYTTAGSNAVTTQSFFTNDGHHPGVPALTYTAVEGDVVTVFNVYGSSAGSGNIQVAVYETSGSTIGAMVGSPVTVNLTPTLGWHIAAATIPLTAGTVYTVCYDFWTGTATVLYRNTGLGGTRRSQAAGTSLPDPWVQSGTTPDESFSIYATVTADSWLPVPVGAATTPAPLLAYNFTESGTSVTDRSGNGRHGTVLAGTTPTDLHSSGEFAPTATGHRLSYDAASDAAARPVNASVVVKIRMPATVGSGNVWSRFRASNSSTFNLYIDSSKLRAVVRGVGGGGATVILEGAPLAASTTYQAALTYDGTTTRLYLDGVEVATSTTTAGNLDWTGTNFKWQSYDHEEDPLALSPFFVDDLRFYDVALTAPQVAALVGVPVSDPAPVYIAPSANITAGGQATTAQLAAPSGKTTADFSVGRMWDDENGTDLVDIGAVLAPPTTDLIIHLAASTLGLANNDPVSSWTDVSPVGTNHATHTGSARPTYIASGLNGLPTVRFDGSDDYLNFPSGFSTWTAGFTWFFVVTPTSVTGTDQLISFNNTSNSTMLFGRNVTAGGHHVFNSGGSVRYGESTAGMFAINTPVIASLHHPGGAADAAVTAAFRKNNVAWGTCDSYVPPVSSKVNNYLGVSSYGPEFWTGDMSEVLIYNRALTDPEITSVYDYLNDKYGF